MNDSTIKRLVRLSSQVRDAPRNAGKRKKVDFGWMKDVPRIPSITTRISVNDIKRVLREMGAKSIRHEKGGYLKGDPRIEAKFRSRAEAERAVERLEIETDSSVGHNFGEEEVYGRGHLTIWLS